MKTKLKQLTLYRHDSDTIQTNSRVIQWIRYLKNERKRFIKHGRQAEIRRDKAGEIALFVDRVA